MNWLGELLSVLVAAIVGAIRSRPAAPAEPPAPPVEAPGFDAIERAEDARLEQLRESTSPVAVPSRAPSVSAVDRAEEAGALQEAHTPPARPQLDAILGEDDPYEGQ